MNRNTIEYACSMMSFADLLGGGAVMTSGVAALGADAVRRIVQTLATFDDFCTPRSRMEHDFEASSSTVRTVNVQIDYLRQGHLASTHQTQRTQLSPSGSSPSC